MKFFLESDRLKFRKMSKNDFDDIAEMLLDKEVMEFWQYDFSNQDIEEWIEKNKDGKYFLAFDKTTDEVVGQVALMPAEIDNKHYYEIGYIFKRKFWGRGYATEAAKAFIDYAINVRKIKKNDIILEIRPENERSVKVAKRLNMTVQGSFTKHFRGNDFLHNIYKFISN